MKIRSDFVTNSSSVSYIVTMCPEMTEIRKKWVASSEENTSIVLEELQKRVLEHGTRVHLQDEEIYAYKVKFSDDEVNYADALGVKHEDVDLAAMDDDQLWDYILGEYLVRGRISSLWGFGATQVETY